MLRPSPIEATPLMNRAGAADIKLNEKGVIRRIAIRYNARPSVNAYEVTIELGPRIINGTQWSEKEQENLSVPVTDMRSVGTGIDAVIMALRDKAERVGSETHPVGQSARHTCLYRTQDPAQLMEDLISAQGLVMADDHGKLRAAARDVVLAREAHQEQGLA